MAKSKGRTAFAAKQPLGVSIVTVAGFKSFVEEQSVELRPLTLLAGANSSGKSSLMQPLLLLKQTLESAFDPGPLLLDGPNVSFFSADEFLSKRGHNSTIPAFSVGFTTTTGDSFKAGFRRKRLLKGLEVEFNEHVIGGQQFRVDNNTSPKALVDYFTKVYRFPGSLRSEARKKLYPLLTRGRPVADRFVISPLTLKPKSLKLVEAIIHLPGTRGNPRRVYPITAVGPRFVGNFENYAGTVLNDWVEKGSNKLTAISEDTSLLSLTTAVKSVRLDDTRLQIQVARPGKQRRSGFEYVNIADVGLGVSYTLPLLVALHVAEPGRLVYVEQPEMHLHPRAQVAMAQVLANAVKRGVRIVAETHSALLILAVQTLIAEGVLAPDQVALHWFTLNSESRSTSIQTAELDSAGRFGDWPEDFADVELKAESRYLTAAESRLANE